MRRQLLLLLPALAACAGPDTAPPPSPATLARLESDDFVARLAERLADPSRLGTPELLHSLEQNMAAWQTEQSLGRAGPLENVLTIQVVTHYEQVSRAFGGPDRNGRLVAAWALGFTRVPDNERGVRSRHGDAVALLSRQLTQTDDDELLRNELTALWRLGDPQTPLQPLLDLVLDHHDPDVRANATLALGTVLTPATAGRALDTVLVAMRDTEPKVRLHAASVARRFPSVQATQRLLDLMPGEDVPLVRASMAAALGASGDKRAGPLLVRRLATPGTVDARAARLALVQLYGEDRGDTPAAWSDLVR